MTIIELRNKRAQKLAAAKAFLESNRNADGFLSAEDDAVYTGMENDITNLGKEISRMERLETMDAELSRPVSTPITEKPDSPAKMDKKTGRASDTYNQAFWNVTRRKDSLTPEMKNALQEGVDSEGGYLVPDEFERTLVQGLNESTVIRSKAHVITTSSGLHKIPVVASHGSASWIDEEGAYTESDDVFGQVQLDAHKVGTIIKVSEELLNDSAFDLEGYSHSYCICSDSKLLFNLINAEAGLIDRLKQFLILLRFRCFLCFRLFRSFSFLRSILQIVKLLPEAVLDLLQRFDLCDQFCLCFKVVFNLCSQRLFSRCPRFSLCHNDSSMHFLLGLYNWFYDN